MDDRTGSSGCLDEGARGSASGMLARMAVAKAGNFGRSWSAVERPSPLSESSGRILWHSYFVLLLSPSITALVMLQWQCSPKSGIRLTKMLIEAGTLRSLREA